MLECIDGRSFGGFCWKEVPRRNGSRKEGTLVRHRIATDSPKLITVVGSGAEICCSKMSCGYCHQSMHHFVHHGQVNIGLAGITVKSKATELNSKAQTTESKSFRLTCQVQRVELSVVYTVHRVLHCTTTYTRAKSQVLDFSTYRICCFENRKKSHTWLFLVIGI